MRIVVSLTTIPGREELLQRAIASLHRQTHRPDAIYLWLPVERFGTDYPLPQFLGVEAKSGPDLGPAMKILPLLPIETDPDTILIPVDDDVEYPPELVEKLAQASAILPHDAIGFTGWNPSRDGDETRIFHLNEEVPCAAMLQNVHVLEGYRGVSYRRRFFEADIFEHLQALDAFRFHDDILLSGYLASRGIARTVRWFGTTPPPPGNYWKLLGDDIGLHTGPNWFAQGMACLDYWSRHNPAIFQPIATLERSERLQLCAEDCPRDGFLHHVQPGASVTGDITQDLNHLPWPWPDACFREILALNLGEVLAPNASCWLEECRRLLKPGGVLKVRLSPTAAGQFPWFHNSLLSNERTAAPIMADPIGFKSFWEREENKWTGTLLRQDHR